MFSKTRIAYIIDRIDAGGTGRQLKLLLERIDKGRFAPKLFLLKGDTSHRFSPRGIPLEVLKVDSLLSIDGARKIHLLARRLRNEGHHIVQTFFQDATFLGVLAAKRAGKPAVVVSIRDLLFWTTPVTFGFYRIAAALADRILVNSMAVKHRVAGFIRKEKIHVIPNGIPVNGFALANGARKSLSAEFGFAPGIPLIVLVSNCNRRVKRVDLMIESIPHVLKRHSAHFMLVGDGNLRPALEQRARSLGIGMHVSFAGQRHDIERILLEADVALNTSDSEGLSNSVMEAMRSELPVVASDVEGNRQLVDSGQNGLLFKAGDAEDLAAKISWFLEDKKRRQKFGKVGRRRIETEFSLERMVAEHEAFYEDLSRRSFNS